MNTMNFARRSMGSPVLITILFAVFLAGCYEPVGAPPWEEERDFRPAPQITSVQPAERTLGGVGTMTITGENFSPVRAENLVYFDDTRAEVIEASVTQLLIRTPNLTRDNTRLRVSVLGAVDFSNTITYHFDPAVEELPGLLGADEPRAIDVDAQGNVFMSYVAFGAAAGILQITPEGNRVNYTPPRAWSYANIEFREDGSLFMVRGGVVPIIYRVPPGGGTEETWLGPAGLGRMQDVAFDEQGFMWAGGENEGTPNAAIFRIDQDKQVERFAFEGNVRSLLAADGHLYVGGSKGGHYGVWRFPITAQNTLGAEELYFDFSNEYQPADARVLAIELTQAGELFIGTDGPDRLLLVSADRSWEVFYPGLITDPVRDLAWGQGSILHALVGPAPPEEGQSIIRIETMKPGPR